MGIRIYKRIGYFFPHKSLVKLCGKGYRDTLDKIFEGENEHTKMKEILYKELSDTSGLESILAKMSLDEYDKKFAEKKDYTPFDQIYFTDTYKGIIVYTIDHSRYQRGDDLIDYYEHNRTPKNKIKRIYNNIYPTYGYEYLGGLPADVEKKLDIKNQKNIDWRHIQVANIVLNNKTQNAEKLVKNGIFAPKMEEEMFAILKSMQIFNPNISEKDFYRHSYPAIITYWS